MGNKKSSDSNKDKQALETNASEDKNKDENKNNNEDYSNKDDNLTKGEDGKIKTENPKDEDTINNEEGIIKSSEDLNTNEQALPEAEQKKPAKDFIINLLYELTSVMISSVVIIAFVFTFLFRLVGVSGSSMNNTLNSGDWLIVKTSYKELDYKDIVIVTQKNSLNETLIKRVIGVGGQTIDIDFEEGLVYIDGKALSENYTATPTNLKGMDYLNFPLTIPEGYLFVMGDNRNNSTDSRSRKVGLIQKENILGKAVGRILPPKSGWDIYSNIK